MILGFTTNTKATGLDAREDDANKLAKGCRVEGDNALCSTSCCIVRVDAVPWDRCFGWFANLAEPVSWSALTSHRI